MKMSKTPQKLSKNDETKKKLAKKLRGIDKNGQNTMTKN